MKTLHGIIRPGIFSILLCIPLIMSGQADKKAAEKKRLEGAIAAAQANVAKYERQLAIADSLMQTGTASMTEAEGEFTAIDADRKREEKEYATEKKLLTKMANASDKEEALKAKNDLKALETKQKGQVKEIDTRVKLVNKKYLTGEANYNKGKGMKKPAKDGLATAQEALAAAEAKLEAAENPDAGGETPKKKKK
ncbi:MAG: hypothetical protein U0T82_12395 [Bacteroidales bacterium]